MDEGEGYPSVRALKEPRAGREPGIGSFANINERAAVGIYGKRKDEHTGGGRRLHRQERAGPRGPLITTDDVGAIVGAVHPFRVRGIDGDSAAIAIDPQMPFACSEGGTMLDRTRILRSPVGVSVVRRAAPSNVDSLE